MAMGYPCKEPQHLLLPLRMPRSMLVLSHISSLSPTITAGEAASAHLWKRKLRVREGRSLAQGYLARKGRAWIGTQICQLPELASVLHFTED